MAKIESTLRAFYAQSVDGAWPKPLPPLTGPEAASVARRLWRVATGKPLALPIVITSGNRRTWTRRGRLVVNPDQGWRDMVHDLSHRLHRLVNRGKAPHDHSHARLEAQLIRHVLDKGWLDGRFRKAPPEKPTADAKAAAKLASIDKRIAAWTSKQKRATNALRKLARQRKYYAAKVAS